jgi:hypothetical protein
LTLIVVEKSEKVKKIKMKVILSVLCLKLFVIIIIIFLSLKNRLSNEANISQISILVCFVEVSYAHFLTFAFTPTNAKQYFQ